MCVVIDDILGTLLLEDKRCIYNYHEHDSLLENKISESLSAEERKTAWNEYQSERNGKATHATSRAGASLEELIAGVMQASFEVFIKTYKKIEMMRILYIYIYIVKPRSVNHGLIRS